MTTAVYEVTLHLSERQIEALRAIGKEKDTFTDWEGRYVSLPDMRQMGLALCVLGFWRLTSIGRQVYEQMFEQQPA